MFGVLDSQEEQRIVGDIISKELYDTYSAMPLNMQTDIMKKELAEYEDSNLRAEKKMKAIGVASLISLTVIVGLITLTYVKN